MNAEDKHLKSVYVAVIAAICTVGGVCMTTLVAAGVSCMLKQKNRSGMSQFQKFSHCWQTVFNGCFILPFSIHRQAEEVINTHTHVHTLMVYNSMYIKLFAHFFYLFTQCRTAELKSRCKVWILS